MYQIEVQIQIVSYTMQTK